MEPAFQDRIPHNACFACGPDNVRGLRIKSRWVLAVQVPDDWSKDE